MRNPIRKRKKKHETKARYYFSEYMIEHLNNRHSLSHPIKMVSIVVPDPVMPVRIVYKISKTKRSEAII